ncbi:hypothetical protein [Actinokineospora fastidiosa]|uniref:Uncharacterized protein n=1 Tax=Actinokineospora fastidiosa TaxID=1816 RepID=A0A918GTE6_9PSEU|nr:hypothetical protein [Actinokineospora fastidiosa]GGS57072.1 hypothetical protein GCM10010171_60010 [Actinokineospora fastidiosa]
MIDVLSTVLTWAAVAAALWALVLVVLNRPLLLDRPASGLLVVFLLIIELALLVQAVIGFIRLAGVDREVDGVSFGGYLLGGLLLLPLAVYWSMLERSRWGMAVVVVGALLIPVVVVRLTEIWSVTGG